MKKRRSYIALYILMVAFVSSTWAVTKNVEEVEKELEQESDAV